MFKVISTTQAQIMKYRDDTQREVKIANQQQGKTSPPFRSGLLCWHTLPKDHFSEMRICRESRSSNHRTAISIEVTLWVLLIQALMASHRQKSC